jgi:hypothetical protein
VPPTATPTAVPPTAADAFPTGLWFDCPNCDPSVQGWTQIYYDDGTLFVYNRAREELRGKWYVEGDTIITGDSWCHDEDAMPASYKWHFDGEFLTMKLIKDDCADRIGSLDGKPWRLIETSPIPMGTYSAKSGDYILELGHDHSFAFSKKNGAYNTLGTFSTNDKNITWETDSYCDKRNSGKATYAWYFEDDVLSFHVVGKDKCVARSAFLLFSYHKEQ